MMPYSAVDGRASVRFSTATGTGDAEEASVAADMDGKAAQQPQQKWSLLQLPTMDR